MRYEQGADDNNNNKRPLTPKSMPPAGDEHAKLKNLGPQQRERKKQWKTRVQECIELNYDVTG